MPRTARDAALQCARTLPCICCRRSTRLSHHVRSSRADRRHKPLPTLDQLQVMYQANPETMSEEDKKRMIRQWNRKRIKDSNALKAKK